MVRVKICGLANYSDAEFALESGADALGFIYEPSSPRYIGDDAELSMMPFKFSPYAVTVGVYGVLATSVDPCQVVQYVELAPHRLSLREKIAKIDIRAMRPAVRAFRIGEGDRAEDVLRRINEAYHQTPNMHAALLDASDPHAYGGTGRKIDWDLAAEIVSELPDLPVVLAGGLTPDNVGEAIAKVKPYGVDVSSGVESEPRKKDPAKVLEFIQAARSAASK
jgi:phosphoribosylanthranilate isomerase